MELQGDVLVLRVREPAAEGAANAACVRALAQALDVPPSRVALVRGARARDKVFAVEGVDEPQARIRLHRGV